jgi:hypothetical protein
MYQDLNSDLVSMQDASQKALSQQVQILKKELENTMSDFKDF